MITALGIDRFKSIRSLALQCKKVNVFIGAPDTGKTNILEALHFICCLGWGLGVGPSLRLRGDLGFEPLFYRQFLDEPIQIRLQSGPPFLFPSAPPDILVTASIIGEQRLLDVKTGHRNQVVNLGFSSAGRFVDLDWVRSYIYSRSEDWSYSTAGLHGAEVITPHSGSNLIYIARHKKEVHEFLLEMVSSLNMKLMFDSPQKAYRLLEVRGEEFLAYNLDLLSDTAKRLFFYKAILLTCQNAALVLDEPDVFAFPPYPKALGEMIADDETNQFFLTTHNPYFLTSLVSKTLTENIAVFICHRDSNGDTVVKLLSAHDLSRVLDFGSSVFFNLDEFLS